jgi:hypothetical protein
MSTLKLDAKRFKEKLLDWMNENNHGDNFNVQVVVGVSPENMVIRFEDKTKIDEFETKLDNFIKFENLSNEYPKSWIEMVDNVGEAKRSIEFRQKRG